MYQVSNYGRVKSLNYRHTGKERLLKPMIHTKGYFLVWLCNKQNKLYSIHRLVAEAFIPNPYNLPQVNHKDEDKTNNHVDNLEWCSLLYNIRYGTGLKRKITNRCKKVYQYTLDGELVKEWESISECSINGFDLGAVFSCCKGERKTHKGYIWSF